MFEKYTTKQAMKDCENTITALRNTIDGQELSQEDVRRMTREKGRIGQAVASLSPLLMMGTKHNVRISNNTSTLFVVDVNGIPRRRPLPTTVNPRHPVMTTASQWNRRRSQLQPSSNHHYHHQRHRHRQHNMVFM